MADGKTKAKRARGMDAARRMEQTVDLLRRTKRHIKEANPSKTAVKARKQRKKFRKILEEVQRTVIREGLSTDAETHLHGLLEDVETAMSDFLAVRPKKKRLKEIRKALKASRKALKHTLT